MKFAVLVWGGWEGHEPRKCVERFLPFLRGEGVETLVSDSLEVFADPETMRKADLVVPCWTMGVLTEPQEKGLLAAVAVGARDEDLFTTLAGRLARLGKIMDHEETVQFEKKAKGRTISEVVKDLLHAYDPDVIESAVRGQFQLKPEDTPSQAQIDGAQEILIVKAASVFTGELNEFIENVRKIHEQIIDTINPDKLEYVGWDGQSKDQAEQLVQDFRAYLETHKDEITALQIFYNQPYRRRELTYAMIRELLERLKADKPTLAPLHVWKAYERMEEVDGGSPINELVALVSLIRRITGIDKTLTPYDKTVDRNFQAWVFKKQAGPLKFTEEQMAWLRMMKEHIAASIHIGKEDLDFAPFDASGGLGKMWQLFGDKTDEIIDEINQALVA